MFKYLFIYLLTYLFITCMLAYCCRLTPVYAILIFNFTSLVVYFGDGPLWAYTDPTNTSYNACKDNWWTNLLYVNNLVHPSHQVYSFFVYSESHLLRSLLNPVNL